MADTETETPASELHAAVVRLRCDHGFPCQPPDGTVWAPGPCMHCSMPFPADADVIPEWLGGPLASWLESWDGIDIREDGSTPDDYRHALAVARALNGSPS